MDEAGDKVSLPPFPENEKALITALLKISETSQDEKAHPDALCGWQPIVCSTSWKKCPNSGSKKDEKPKNKGNNALQWKEVVQLENLQNSKNNVQPKKKRPKFHIKRMEELSHPRKIRDKVTLNSHTKMIVPFNNRRPLNPVVYFDNKLFAMTKVALRYGESGPELGQLSRSFDTQLFRTEKPRSAHERHPTGGVVRELLSSKKQIHSAGIVKKASSKSSKQQESALPSILVKTRADAGTDWEELSCASDFVDDILTEYPEHEPSNDVDLPLPQAKLSNKTDRPPRFPEWTIAFPPLQPRSNKKQRALGSITAITQGNINAGIKTNSIKKIRRPALVQHAVIFPKLSGSKVEVPLLPQSPDFLRRLM